MSISTYVVNKDGKKEVLKMKLRVLLIPETVGVAKAFELREWSEESRVLNKLMIVDRMGEFIPTVANGQLVQWFKLL